MRGKSPRGRGNAGWQRVQADPAKIGPLMREAGFVACDDDPDSCWGYFDRQGRPRRLHAHYPGGWRATLVMRLDGTYSLSMAIKIVSRKADA